ncbi:translation initiation factor IF-2 N-terminal domain-containing protein [Pseudonocardia sp. GCM10023141]|uniref:translation initiation factor IF-2 N-terminal domain-containing protein n=1 Tax=Pseudonocardia sp. GCM10023141 TaxID=3252653 RepID=UPI0036193CFB
MSNIDSPAGSTGGPVTVPALDELPDKMRVHALAKLIGSTSKDVLAVLAGLGIEAKSAQSSIDRKAAEQVIVALQPDAAAAPPAADPVIPTVAEPVIAAEPVADLEQAPEPAPKRGRKAALAPVFAPPAAVFQPPARPTRTRRRAPDAFALPEPAADEAAGGTAPEAEAAPEQPVAADVLDVEPTDVDTVDPDGDAESDDDGAARRRRRRGRRGRGRGRGGDGLDDENDDDSDEESGDDAAGQESGEADDTDESDGESADEDSDESDDQADGDASGSRRRRRRRRRRGSGDDAADGADDDPPGTVTRVRAPREARSERVDSESDGDGVQSVRGSTRLEAKRQRRRDGRDAGRRRVPILSEAEFLARREAVDRTMVVRERGDRVEVAVLEDDILVEHFIAGRSAADQAMVGNIYLGRVQNVLPSMEAAFVDIGRGRNAVLYAGEVDWDAAGLGGKARRIEQALSSGDSVLVQVTKDPLGHKGARLTTQISLAGRFLVYVPGGGAAGISRKLPDVERKRLKDMLKEIVPSEAGVIIRTASEGVSHEALERDVRRLQAQWEIVKEKSEKTGPNKPKAPVLLYEEPDLLIKVVRDQFNEDFSRLVIEGDDAWDTLSSYVGHVAPELTERLHRHVGTTDVFSEYRIDEQLLKALDRKVWLPSGGTLVIDRTEAMTVIDVNTGKFTGSGGNLEETVTRNNLEAAEEVVRQLRLRDIGGIIVIDFIDMVLEANRDLVLRRLTECLARDRTRHQVAEVTSLGLVQMTRKRVGGGLLEHFSTPCEHCRGRGVIISTEPVVEKGGSDERGRDDDRGGRGGDREASGRRSRGGRGGRNGGDQERNGNDSGRNGNGGGGNGNGTGHGRGDADVDAPVEPVRPQIPAPMLAAAARSVAPAVAPAAETPAVVAPAESIAAVPDGSPAEPAPVVSPVAARTVTSTDPDTDAAVEPVAGGNGRAPRRRGRVTRTAGAPAPASGEAPVATVVTVPAARVEEQAEAVAAPAPVSVAPQPEPTVVTKPRRTRRAASRPAGPPVGEATPAEGDPV